MTNRIAHTAKGVGYRVGNSFRGIRRWLRRGYRRGDHDLQITKADPNCPYLRHPEHVGGICRGHLVNTHWARPLLRDKFRDPTRQVRLRQPVNRMTLDEVLRLHSEDGYKIRTPEQILRFRPVRRGRYVPVWEPKGDPRFKRLWPWIYLAGLHDEYGIPLQVRSLRDHPNPGDGVDRIAAARRGAKRAGNVPIKAWLI